MYFFLAMIEANLVTSKEYSLLFLNLFKLIFLD